VKAETVRTRPLLGAALALLAAAASPAAGAQTDTPSTAELEALYWERQRAAQERYTADDVRFMTGMIGHHAQALVMAEMARRNGAGPAVRRLAARIDNAQRDEIRTMQRWLEDRGEPVPRVHIEGTRLTIHMNGDDHAGAGHGGMDHGQADPSGMGHSGMDYSEMDHGGMDHSQMPGMLSDAQLAELDAARGIEFDRLFLAYMIQHHGGAVVMVDELFAADGAAQEGNTFKLASDIQVDQRTEIARMQLLLDDLTND
jgi:uncharacterized protein (DUF305 family)